MKKALIVTFLLLFGAAAWGQQLISDWHYQDAMFIEQIELGKEADPNKVDNEGFMKLFDEVYGIKNPAQPQVNPVRRGYETAFQLQIIEKARGAISRTAPSGSTWQVFMYTFSGDTIWVRYRVMFMKMWDGTWWHSLALLEEK